MSALAEAVRGGDRRALARAITLVESTRKDHRAEAEAVLGHLLPHSGALIRLGVSGAPGVGKSTFIERLGVFLIGVGHCVAVLAVDPSSKRTGGSILADKTRMQELARSEAAFIRPSPAAGTLGGVARRTREAMLMCEAAGFDVIIVETVGVGQSEAAVADMVDMFLLLLQPGGGDELQGLKKGAIELADLLIVNKADGELEGASARAAADYGSAVRLLRPPSSDWIPLVLRCSSLTGKGIPEVWDAVGRYRMMLDDGGRFASRRSEQARAWMWNEVDESLLAALRSDPKVKRRLSDLEAQVVAGGLSPTIAARKLLDAFLGRNGSKGSRGGVPG